MKLDRLDLAILDALQRDARASLEQIGTSVGLTKSPCWTRIDRMQRSGLIEGYTVRLNAVLAGWPDTVIVQLTLGACRT